jgi:RNA-directed DNA polymerase
VQPRLRSASALIRYCDDFVMLFACKEDAERLQAVLGKRLAKFGLELHPDKTRLVDFSRRPSAWVWNGVANDLYVPGLSPHLE